MREWTNCRLPWSLPALQLQDIRSLARLSDASRSRARILDPVRAREPHFKVFPEFKAASYAKRYEILLTKLVRERLYDAACFLLSDAEDGPNGQYSEPSAELGFQNFVVSLTAKVIAISKSEG